jgi:hypothetical protein
MGATGSVARRVFGAEPDRCECGGCDRRPAGLFTWGLYPNGSHNDRVPLCRAHADEAWAESRGLVSAGLCHWACEPVSDWSKGV